MNKAIEFDRAIRQQYISEIDELLNLAIKIVGNQKQAHELFHATVDEGWFAQWRTTSLSLLEDIFGQDSSIYKEFDKHTQHGKFGYEITQGHGVLISAKVKLKGDLPINLKQLLYYLQNIPPEKKPVGFQV